MSAVNPVIVEDIEEDGRWISMHQHFINLAKEKEPEVLFVGDTIIERLVYTDFWERLFVPLHCLNFGIEGDQTQNVLWRLQNGELDNIEPKVVVVCVGTNNKDHTAEEVTLGILEIANLISQKQPQAQIIIMGIPPRGEYPNKHREKIEDINSSLQEKVPEISNAQYFQVDQALFVNTDGRISHIDMNDYLHLTPKGYTKLLDPLLEEVESILKNFMTADAISACSQGSAGD